MAHSHQVTLDIDDELPEEDSTRIDVLNRTDSTPRVLPANRGNLGIGDRLNSVFRDIRLVENARMGTNSRLSLPTWLPIAYTPNGIQRPRSSAAHVNLAGPSAQPCSVSERDTPRPSLSAQDHGDSQESNTAEDAEDINISVNPASNNNIHEEADNDSHSDDGLQQIVDVRSTLNVLVKYAPFYLLLFIKLLYDSRETIFTFSVLLITFLHCNALVRREHGKQMNHSLAALFCELVFTSCSIGLVHYFCGHGRLLPNVIMFPGYTDPIDVWEMLWLVVCTDLIVKIITVDVKIVVTMAPAFVLPFQKRGKVYLFVEAVSQLYRSVLTVQPWVYFLMGAYAGSERVVGMFLTSLYAVVKVVEVLYRLRLFKNATWTLLQSVDLGTKPTVEQLVSAGDSCPICHDDYTTPVRLACTHIFCELCISAWLDREHTCPLCRAKVAEQPTWRDGSTTYDIQLY